MRPEKTIMILPPQCSVIYVGKLHRAPAESVERIRAPSTKLVMANQQRKPPTRRRHGQSGSCFCDHCLYYLHLHSLHDQSFGIVQLPVVWVLIIDVLFQRSQFYLFIYLFLAKEEKLY